MQASPYWFIQKTVAWISNSTGRLAGVLILVMTVTILIDVVGRAAFNQPLAGGVELNRTFLVAVVFFSLGLTQLNKGHIRVDILLVKASPRLTWLLDMLALAVGTAVFAVITYMTVPVTLRSIRIGEYETGIVNFPMWPARLLMTLGLLLFTIQLAADLVDAVRQRRPEAKPRQRQLYE